MTNITTSIVRAARGPQTFFGDLNEAEQATAKAVIDLRAKSQSAGSNNPVGVIVFVQSNPGEAMRKIEVSGQSAADVVLGDALFAASTIAPFSKATLAISVDNPKDSGLLSAENLQAFRELGGQCVLLVGIDRSVVISSVDELLPN